VNATEAHRQLLKLPDLAYFVVPHPIVSMSDDEIANCAQAIVHGVNLAITRDRAGK
jgi:hypothetical protein